MYSEVQHPGALCKQYNPTKLWQRCMMQPGVAYLSGEGGRPVPPQHRLCARAEGDAHDGQQALNFLRIRPRVVH